jgi:hypothetical protein
MKKIFQQIVDFPHVINQKVLNAQLNTEVEQFDSQNGIRHYTKTIYQIVSVIVFICLEIAVIKGAITYFQDAAVPAMAKAGSALTTILLVYAAFPIAQVIKSRGESLGGSHNGMVSFIFKDFVTTNIKIVGETTAIVGFIGVLCMLLSYLTDNQLYMYISNESLMGSLAGLYSLPMEAFSTLFNMLKLDYLGGVLNSIVSFKMSGATNFNNDFSWNINDLLTVGGQFVNVLVGLAMLYVNLAIYHFLYTMVSNFIHWIQSPSLPLSIKNK